MRSPDVEQQLPRPSQPPSTAPADRHVCPCGFLACEAAIGRPARSLNAVDESVSALVGSRAAIQRRDNDRFLVIGYLAVDFDYCLAVLNEPLSALPTCHVAYMLPTSEQNLVRRISSMIAAHSTTRPNAARRSDRKPAGL